MSGYVQQEIERVVADTEAILAEATSDLTREQAMRNAYKDIAMLIKLDEMDAIGEKVMRG
jgi:hypothetical protein